MTRLLVIDNYDSFTWNLVQAFEVLGARCDVVLNDAIEVLAARAMAPDGIVISPGPRTPTEAGVSVELIRSASGVVPILGVCLGHQSIAQAFGGKIVRAARLMHGKTSPIEHDETGVFAGLPQRFVATRYHSLIVERESLPTCLSIDAWTAEGEIMGLRHAEHPTFGVQFHPESFMTPDGPKLLASFLSIVRGAG